jgi:superfamily II DNA helicase RecQ
LFVALAQSAKHPVLVASPLAAELHLSAQHLAGVEVVGLGSFVSAAAQVSAKKRLVKGGPLLVVLEPAQLFDSELRKLASKTKLALLGVAAAHACSEHAHEIAPAYLSLREATRTLALPTLATCTRTSQRVLDQICEAIGGSKGSVISAAEPELERLAQVVRSSERRQALLAALLRVGTPAIVLTATVQEADAVFAELSAQKVACVRAHSGMGPSEREAALARFAAPGERLVLVTQSPHANASGLAGCGEVSHGLGSTPPRADLRCVVHYQAPLSPEQHFEDLAWLPVGGSSLVLADSSDAALVQALLAQQRIKPAAIESVAQALAQAPADRPTFADTLALRAGTSRRSAERVLSALADRNLIARQQGQIARRVTPEALATEARLLSARFATLRAADSARAEAVARYVTTRHHSSSAPARSASNTAANS